ncbi:MAG: hypothetical protein HY769_08420 [Candidatus Stahlbacteria bacterium]|nr:hypothetical protein [Candidatus Stahlbacteria bacterium]
MFSITDALHKPGFSLIEVISPCLIYYANEDKVGEPIDRMRYFHNHTVIKHNEPTENWDIRRQDKIIIGKFVDR